MAKSPDNTFYFRRRAELLKIRGGWSKEENISSSDIDNETLEDDEQDPEPVPEKGEQTLCCQSKQQKRLMHRYGNEICLLDTTYKTTRYALPLFFLCVRTNVCHQIVGTFIVQYSTTEAIQEALSVFKKWNPSWVSCYFMTDFAEEKILAIENVFKGVLRGTGVTWSGF